MSDLLTKPQLSDSKDCPASSSKPIHQLIQTKESLIGDNLKIRRALPNRERRMIGAWCFLDHFGPLDLNKSKGLDIAPHPHIGLQTFTWLLAGEILHRDSLDSKQVIQPGQVNLMTAGKGISHSEESLPGDSLHGVQLWIALPDEARHTEPNFFHYPEVPSLRLDDLFIHLLAGDYLGMQAPAKIYSPLMGVEIDALENKTTKLPLNPTFEYGVLPLVGNVKIENEEVQPGTLMYLGCGRSGLSIEIPKGSRILMIGGEPFKEEILIWWNFVARTKQEIIQATDDWNNKTRFGTVRGYDHGRLTAPSF